MSPPSEAVQRRGEPMSAEAPPLTPAEAVRRLRAAMVMAGEGRWAELLASTASHALLRLEPRLLTLRVRAARALDDRAAMDDLLAFCAREECPGRIRLGLCRDLVAAGLVAEAWGLIKDDASLRADPLFLTVSSRLRAQSKDRALRREIQGEIDIVSKGGAKVRSQRTSLAFPAAGPPTAHTKAELVAAPGTAERHMHRLGELRARFLHGMRRAKPPAVGEYRDVFIDRYGQIWDEAGRVIVPCSMPIPAVTRAQVPQVETGLMLCRATRGFYHWLVDRVPMLAWQEAPGAEPVSLLMSEGGPAFEGETLDLLGVPAVQRVPVGSALFCRRLLTAHVGLFGMANWGHVAPLMARLTQAALERARGQDLPRRIYISRRDAKRRSMLNEAALESELRRRGITPVIFTGMPQWQQIALVAQADLVVSPHGAGLAHLLLARPGARVFEILPIDDGTYQLRFNYARLSMMRGLAYSAWVQQVQSGLLNQDWTLDMPGFLSFLDARLPG